ncbi:Uu.00g072120.m01.CDS01 [Anthostomella pinea]|uniref:Uu.00g072120.m01.CDS01 n=1 Tax=Anthostomella pinea TaxID=933095 RepID=A0AAI8VV12_9PEZI|nr:Uu.00g072120.m01.CDS01 [Anthostomella pinea]
MSYSDKRKGSTHALRSSASSRSSNIIAPPPRAQLTRPASSLSSPTPGNDAAHETSNSSNKDGGAASAAEERESILLKKKDDKIAELKQELVIMETEFARELDQLSQNESGAASFWQTKHSTVNQQFLRMETELRLLRNEVDVKEAERTELREGWEALRRELRDRNEEIRSLKGHIAGLKQWVSTSTKKSDQTSDEEFGETVAKLRNGLQNWVVSHFRKSSLDLRNADQEIIYELSELVPMYEELAIGETKPHLLQSVVSSILVEMIFDKYFVGLTDEQSAQFEQMEKYLASLSSPESVNQWRATTLTMLRQAATSEMQTETAVVTESVVSRINHILNAITNAMATDARDQALRVLVNNSIGLARLLVVQKAVFKVIMPKFLPRQRESFDAATMDHVGEEDEESLTAREICCVTFPGIIKTGDENGSHLQFRNVIAKARVLCRLE